MIGWNVDIGFPQQFAKLPYSVRGTVGSTPTPSAYERKIT